MLRPVLVVLLASFLPIYALYAPIDNASPQIVPQVPKPTKIHSSDSTPRPLVIWHGLGDSYNAPGMLQFIEMVKEAIPGIFVHSVYLDEDQDKDRQAGFYGNVNDQVKLVSEQLTAIPELQIEGGFDAMGFSQGGQFLRAYVERYNSPPVHNLLTFGSQHMGISDIPPCRPYDLLCQVARRATRAGVYGSWAQENLVQAQYYRDPNNLATYLTANHFLADINNELIPLSSGGNETYAKNLASLNKLILILFTEDKTVVPKESSWFGSEAAEGDELAPSYGRRPGFNEGYKGSQEQIQLVPPQARSEPVFQLSKQIIPMHSQPLYIEDWIGLRTLDERGDVELQTCKGEHMQLDGCWEDLVAKWVGK
ncbi:hypothetical protein D9758_009935 [Tetrapyrgos nigripes]|uniref:Palmitoyl-protein thioesterase 1 n=1 Tax=Tetrapyrgos nigripes TaxID=182062 RepID=A0A8H5CSA8_9AGAR|nr:hypothetical protein D9758_009935 [Tetrapyrgos nigripes]